jgi:hypothetical protein
MQFLHDLLNVPLELLAAILQSPFGPWLEGTAVAMTLAFVVTDAGRRSVDEALGGGSGVKRLGILDLSRGDAAGAMELKVAVAPERLWTYDEAYLEHFVDKAGGRTDWGPGALVFYVKFVLRSDMVFAVFLAAFIVLFWWAIATAPWAPIWLGRLALFAAGMGILYGFADIAEDLKLSSILVDPSSIDPAEAAAANALTRLKFAAIALSIVGVLVFGVLSLGDVLAAKLTEILIAASRRAWVILRPSPGDSGETATGDLAPT